MPDIYPSPPLPFSPVHAFRPWNTQSPWLILPLLKPFSTLSFPQNMLPLKRKKKHIPQLGSEHGASEVFLPLFFHLLISTPRSPQKAPQASHPFAFFSHYHTACVIDRSIDRSVGQSVPILKLFRLAKASISHYSLHARAIINLFFFFFFFFFPF